MLQYMALAPMVSEIRDLKSNLVHIRELLGVLFRKGRSAEAKAEIAARRLDRMERERDQESEAECEATLEEALADHSKVVKVIVDKWFVDKGFGFGKTPKKTEKNVECCSSWRRAFNNLWNVHGCDDECGDIHGKEFHG